MIYKTHDAVVTKLRSMLANGIARAPAFLKGSFAARQQAAPCGRVPSLTRRGVLIEDMGQTYLAESDADGEESRTLRPLHAAAIAHRIAFGSRAGQKG